VESLASSLTVTASSANTTLIPNQNIHLTGTGTDRTISFTPAANQFGNSEIMLTVTDPGGVSTTKAFRVGVNAVNDPPTLDAIPDLILLPNAGPQTILLRGISSGPSNEFAQNVTITATSSNPGLIPDPLVTYSDPDTIGALTFSSQPNATGVALLTVTAQDDAGTANGGQNSFSRVFVVTVSTAPTLRIVRNSNLVVLSWPTNMTGFHLESRPGLSGPSSWMTVTPGPAVAGDQNVVTNSLGAGYRFFRLVSP